MSSDQPLQPPQYTFKDVTAPLTVEQMREFFQDKTLFHKVHYAGSRIKGAALLTYLTNMNLPSDLVFERPVPADQYREIMKAYFDQRTVANLSILAVMACQLLLLAKGFKWEDIPYETGATFEQAHEFLLANTEQITRWVHFLDSSMVYGMTAIGKLNEEHKPKEVYLNIDDREYVGHNVVNLYTIPQFTALYFMAPIGPQSYFVRQFEDYMFANKRMEFWFNHPHNFLAATMTGMASGTLTPENMAAFFDPNTPADHEFPGLQAPADGQLQDVGADEGSGQLPPQP